MSISKPYHRMYRPMIQSANSGYSGVGYLRDPDYAAAPGKYVRGYLLIQKDLEKLFEYIEPSPEAEATYSFRIHELFMRTCIEIEANFKAILEANTYAPATNQYNRPIYDMRIYKKVNVSHHLSSYKVILPMWDGPQKVWEPFKSWETTNSIGWYQAYNASKHDRLQQFKQANFGALLSAVSGLLVLISSQFQSEEYSSANDTLTADGYDYHDMEAATGSLFRIAYPTDWPDDEKYDFDWSALQSQPDKFQRFNYNAVP